jgi:uncharacterized DUF497 family protein
MSAYYRILIVVILEKVGHVFHIISARRATKHERRAYEEDR